MARINDCLFCSLAADRSKLIWENDVIVAFKDIHPKAPVHVLVVPKRHVADLDHLEDAQLAGQLLMAVREVAKQVGISGAYRVHNNNGKAAGQVIEHLHLHVLGGFKTADLDDLRGEGL